MLRRERIQFWVWLAVDATLGRIKRRLWLMSVVRELRSLASVKFVEEVHIAFGEVRHKHELYLDGVCLVADDDLEVGARYELIARKVVK